MQIFTEPKISLLDIYSVLLKLQVKKPFLKYKVKTPLPLPSNGNCYQYMVVADEEVQHWPLW